MPRRLIGRHGLVVLAIVPTLGLAACGSKDKKDTNRAGGYGSALSKSDFVSKANVFCKSASAASDKLSGGFSNPPTQADVQAYVVLATKQNADAKALVPPAGALKDAWDTAGTDARAALVGLKQAALVEDATQRTSLLQAASKEDSANDAALTAAGLTECGKD